LPAGRERDQTELRLLLLLAAQLIATEGYGADRVEHIYGRALALCQAAGDDKSMMKVLLGLEGFHFMRADFAKAHTFAARAAVMAAASDDPVRRLQSTWAIANILFHQGEVATAVAHMDACLDDYQHTQIRRGGVQDPAVMCLCYSAWAQWELGYPDDALRRAHRVVEFSATLNHPFSLGEAYGFLTAVQHFRGENEDALHSAERAIEICEEHGFAVWLAHAKLMRGRIMAALGEVEEGIEHMRHAFEMWSATGAVVTQPFYLALQAEGLALAGRAAEGLAVLDQAFAIVRACGERYYEPEIRRLIGALTLQAGAQPGGSGAAEEWFRSGLAVAATTKLRSLGLRCATSLARLLFAQGRNGEALAALQPSLGWFAEGRDTRDLQQAHGLLHELLDASPISQ
jgi:predicted ATPase